MLISAAQGECKLLGIVASSGVCRGKVRVLGRHRPVAERRELSVEEVPAELGRLEQALLRTREQLQAIQGRMRAVTAGPAADIFDAHLLTLDDPVLLQEVTRTIREKRLSADYAFHLVAEGFAASFAAMQDDYLRERAADVRDVADRVLGHLLGVAESVDLAHLPEPCIIVAHDLAPSQTAQMDRRQVLGFATDVGSRTSHTAIMAQSLGIPAVVGLKDASERIVNGSFVLLDGVNGELIVHPTDQTLYAYGQLEQRRISLSQQLQETVPLPAVTRDGHSVILSANIEHARDTRSVKDYGAEGVGLFRTEYLFLRQSTLPTEEEQYQTYRTVAQALKPAPVVLRTLDLGGDKFRTQEELPKEMNPSLGWRAIRFCLQQTDLFRAQLRAILRASAEGNVKMMYPMISGLGEADEANLHLAACQAELRAAGIPFDENLEVGAMIETPSAAVIADLLARRLKFFSIGTNDLIQYALAVDRTNEKIAHLYEPTHPAILRLIKSTVDAAHHAGIWVGVCGQMAGDLAVVPLLLGLGVDELSVAPSLVPPVKFLIRRLAIAEARTLAATALSSESGAETLARCREFAQAAAPELFNGAP